VKQINLLLVFTLSIVVLFISCETSDGTKPIFNTNTNLIQEKIVSSKDQILLDNIKGLINQEDWYSAHSAIVNFKLRFPDSDFSNEITALTKEVRKSLLAQQIFKNTHGEIITPYDSITKKLRKEKDEEKKRIFYHALESTPYINEDAVQAYLSIPLDSLTNPSLQFTVQNVSKLDYKLQYIQFSIDKTIYPYLPTNTFSDHGYGYYWQWFDDVVEDDKVLELLKKVAEAKETSITFFLEHNYKTTRKISKKEQEGLQDILNVFEKIKPNSFH